MMAHAKNYETMSTFVKVMHKKLWPLFSDMVYVLKKQNLVAFCVDDCCYVRWRWATSSQSVIVGSSNDVRPRLITFSVNWSNDSGWNRWWCGRTHLLIITDAHSHCAVFKVPPRHGDVSWPFCRIQQGSTSSTIAVEDAFRLGGAVSERRRHGRTSKHESTRTLIFDTNSCKSLSECCMSTLSIKNTALLSGLILGYCLAACTRRRRSVSAALPIISGPRRCAAFVETLWLWLLFIICYLLLRIYDSHKQSSSNLNSGLGQVDFYGDLFPGEYIWISGLLEQRFQYVELRSAECRSFASLLPRTACSCISTSQRSYIKHNRIAKFQLLLYFIALLIQILWKYINKAFRRLRFELSTYGARGPTIKCFWHWHWKSSYVKVIVTCYIIWIRFIFLSAYMLLFPPIIQFVAVGVLFAGWNIGHMNDQQRFSKLHDLCSTTAHWCSSRPVSSTSILLSSLYARQMVHFSKFSSFFLMIIMSEVFELLCYNWVHCLPRAIRWHWCRIRWRCSLCSICRRLSKVPTTIRFYSDCKSPTVHNPYARHPRQTYNEVINSKLIILKEKKTSILTVTLF